MHRIFLVAITGCAATHYQHEVQSPAIDTEDVHAELAVQGDVVHMALVNKTTDILQIQWNQIRLDRADGTTTPLHPTIDLGWVLPSARVETDLVPLVFADQMMPDRRYTLRVPVIVNKEPRTFNFALVVHTHPVKS
ncbi:MAG TPA: hypothetical protein VGC41_19285 [Kofleriaceae bacterium]